MLDVDGKARIFLSGQDSIRTFSLLLMALMMTASACTTGTQTKPYYDSDIAGKKAKRAEFSSCAPRTETGPILLDGKLPQYPRQELMSGYAGSVDVQFVVSETGTTTHVEILSATSRRFADEVKTAVGEWMFQPAMDQGMPVAVVCAQKHHFDYE